MTRLSLRLLAVSALGVSLFASVGCGSSEVSAGSSGMFAPQTGSNLGRRLPLQTRSRMVAAARREKEKRQKPKTERRRERADEDYMTRGGFR